MSSPNNRAQLLSGLRTAPRLPQTAAPTASFNIPRIPSGVQSASLFPSEDQFAHHHAHRAMPMTAAVDGPRFAAQQHSAPMYNPQAQAQAQALQMQMMQIELMRMQALQAQQYQAQLFAAQNQRRPNFNPPATAGVTGSFNSAPLGVPMQRYEDQVPMTAALDGKFAMRPAGRFPAEDHSTATNVISGGTSLGSPAPAAVSKSETAANWRRAGNNNSVLRKKTSISPPPALSKARPQGLSINSSTAVEPLPVVAIDSESENDDGYSSHSSDSGTPPTTPRSASSIELAIKDKKPMANGTAAKVVMVVTRQPRGPPSGPDELGNRNFAARIAARSVPSIVVAA